MSEALAAELDFSGDDIQRLLDNLDIFSLDEIAEIDKMAGATASKTKPHTTT